jgi:hypothetical protein
VDFDLGVACLVGLAAHGVLLSAKPGQPERSCLIRG